MSQKNHLYAVLLAGGGGTRLWPKSRGNTPKQFLRLAGENSMMQIAAERVSRVLPWEQIIVVTNKKYYQEVLKQLPKIKKDNIIAEPEKKDTAFAMLVGAQYAKHYDPEAIVINAASDHIVTDMPEFIRVMQAAARTAAESNYLITVGILPQYPTSAFGYIKVGNDIKKLEKGLNLFEVSNFTEKPNIATASAFISTGKYFWNANMYVWSVKEINKAFQKHMPAMWELAKGLSAKTTAEFQAALPEIYRKAESISIDYAISEKAANLVLIPGNFGWNDVGDWNVVYQLGKKDLSGNVIINDSNEDEDKAILINAQQNLVHTDGRLITLLGVNDLVVVDTEEALLICPRKMSQDVKKIVQRLKENKKEEYL